MKTAVKWLSKYLPFVVVTPCILLALIVSYDATKAWMAMKGAAYDEYNALSSDYVLQVVHEVQKERGNTAGFIGSQGTRFSDSLKQQRRKTDEVLKRFDGERSNWMLDEETNQRINVFRAKFRQLQQIRNQVDALSIALPQALAFYTSINTAGLDSVAEASLHSTDVKVSEELFTIFNFAYAKEAAGIERAVLSNVLAADRFTPELRSRHIRLITRQQVRADTAIAGSPKLIRPILQQALANPAMQKVDRYRLAVANTDSGFNLAAEDWFKAATERINVLKKAETDALKVVEASAHDTYTTSVQILVAELILLVVGLVITVLLALIVRMRGRQSELILTGINRAVNSRDLADEIRVISQDDLGTSAIQVNQLTQKFSNDLKEFGITSNKIANATHDTSAAIGQSQANLLEQKKAVQYIADIFEEMGANIQVISNSMDENAQTARQVVTESEKGQTVVSGAVNEIQQVAEEMEYSAKAIDELNDKVGSISGMVDLIRGIAEQTNLLALNAAIEAARAGEQGRGFAVVADEVRSLASRTQDSTEQISELVSELQSSSAETSAVITKGKDNAIAAAERAEQIKHALEEIVSQVKNVESVTHSVSINTKEQENAIGKVNGNINEIYDKAVENVAGAEQIAIAAKQIIQSADDMDKMIERYTVH